MARAQHISIASPSGKGLVIPLSVLRNLVQMADARQDEEWVALQQTEDGAWQASSFMMDPAPSNAVNGSGCAR